MGRVVLDALWVALYLFLAGLAVWLGLQAVIWLGVWWIRRERAKP